MVKSATYQFGLGASRQFKLRDNQFIALKRFIKTMNDSTTD